MLKIETFDARAGGNVIYKALAHPLAAEGIARLYAKMRIAGPAAIYDPDGIFDALAALHPDMPETLGVFVHDTQRLDGRTRPITELSACGARAVLIAAFDANRIASRIGPLMPDGARVLTLDEARLPEGLLTVPGRTLDRLNYATNFVFFREADGLSTRLVSANYWTGYGARAVKFWLRLFAEDGSVLATWDQAPPANGTFAIDSAAVRERFGLPPFRGQLFIHAVGVAGHDVVKYALDTFANDGGPSLSCTHDANAWPSDRYAGLPAPRPGERVTLWLQNSHASEIPAGAVTFDPMGAEAPVGYPHAVAPFASVPVDVASMLPDLAWPAQIEVRTGRHVVRPRYEVAAAGRTRIAHINVERANLLPDPDIRRLHPSLGRGYLLPFPVLHRDRYETVVQPNPMAETQASLPLRLDLFAPDGTPVSQLFLGNLPRDHGRAWTVDGLEEGHGELVYDFRDGGEADGWMHTLVRYQDRLSGHAAETSFGAHMFNTAMTYRDEPQSYAGPPPGLSTRLFLRLGEGARRAFAYLIYPASAAWHPFSDTALLLHDATGTVIAEAHVAIACSGSRMVRPDAVFGMARMRQAGPAGYMIVRDATCRLFGYHGLMDASGGFSLDHMFGF